MAKHKINTTSYFREALRNVKGKVPKNWQRLFFVHKTREVKIYIRASLLSSTKNASYLITADGLHVIHNKHTVGYG